jgi:UDP-N-acetylglucosamine--N-acetylmuramyl-(pentapeptide) pyrophosphoryl-undecaprenol N-acetylglucosamine transferase
LHKGNDELRVLIAGGGTGGHIYPGIAIAKEIRRRHPEATVLFVGTERGLENQIVPKAGFRLETITVSGLKGLGRLRQLKNALAIPTSLWESRGILRRFKPDVVVGVGGYSSGPPVLMASLKGIPSMLQEQNAQPGLTNRMLTRFVKKVAAGFEECEETFGKKTVVTGNPVRREFSEVAGKSQGTGFTVLVTGGSQGARAINQAVVEALPLLKDIRDLYWIHQTGMLDYQAVLLAYQAAGTPAAVREFFDDMPNQFARANLLVCRSGAITLAEITVAGKAAILVPFPGAADDHQRKNAEALVRAGAAEMIPQRDLDGKVLAQRIRYLIENRNALSRMEQKSRRLGKPDATGQIVDLVEELCGLRA